MFVYEVMKTDVHTIHPEATFNEILDILLEQRISGVPVVTDDGSIVGILSEKDLFSFMFPVEEEFYANIEYWKNPKHLEDGARNVSKMRAKDFLTREVITVRPSDTVMTACSLLLVHKIRRLPVVQDKKMVGIVTTNDLYRNFLGTFV